MSDLFTARRSLRPILWILSAAAGFVLALGAISLFLTPRILTVRPATGQAISGYTPVEVDFSVPMDPECAENHFLLDPALPGRMEWAGSTLRFLPAAPWPAGQIIRVTVRAGACSAGGLSLLTGTDYSFQRSGSRITYITSANGMYRLMAVDSEGKNAVVLLQSELPIQDYEIASRGDFLVYSLGPYDTPSNLWILQLDSPAPELLLDCAGDACRSPAISPDGSLVAFLRSPMQSNRSSAVQPGLAHMETIRLMDSTTATVSPNGHIASNPSWAPTGWLSYYDATDRVVVVDDLLGGKTFIPSATGERWSWFPDGQGIIFPETKIVGGDDHETEQPITIISNLIMVTIEGNARKNLSGDPQLEDSAPVISPDGKYLAFARNFFDSRWTPGKQLWLMNLKYFTAAPVTNLPDFGHSSFRWSPDGSALLFMRYHETKFSDPPEIWLVDSTGGNAVRISVGGYSPQWLP